MSKPELRLSGQFVSRAKTALAPGDWYVAFRCQKCGAGSAILDDPTGTGMICVSGDAQIEFVCPACGTVNRTQPAMALIIQSPTGGLTIPAETMEPRGVRQVG